MHGSEGGGQKRNEPMIPLGTIQTGQKRYTLPRWPPTLPKYKEWNAGIITSRVSPRYTSRECACCHSAVARYAEGQSAEGYTPGTPLVLCRECGVAGNADRNASLVIGQRLVARSQRSVQEKPPTPLTTERGTKVPGVVVSQEAESEEGPSIPHVRHGDNNEHGTGAPHRRQKSSATKVVGVVGKPSAPLTYPCRKA